MRSLLISLFLSFLIIQVANGQNLSGYWSGEITQERSEFKIGSIEITMTQVGRFLSGQIKTIHPEGFVIQKFRGMLTGYKVVLTEYEVIDQSKNQLPWCIKVLEGFLFTYPDKKSPVIKGKWTSHKGFQAGNYMEGDCPPGTFSISLSSVANVSQSKPSVKIVTEPKKPAVIILSTKIPENIKKEELPNFPKPRLGDKVILALQFERSKATILPSSEPELNRILYYLITYPTLEIELSGHTDNVGDAIKNQKLSEERVNMVRRYLVRHNIAPGRISGKGFGGRIPVAPNNNEENRKANRRVEMKVVKE